MWYILKPMFCTFIKYCIKTSSGRIEQRIYLIRTLVKHFTSTTSLAHTFPIPFKYHFNGVPMSFHSISCECTSWNGIWSETLVRRWSWYCLLTQYCSYTYLGWLYRRSVQAKELSNRAIMGSKHKERWNKSKNNERTEQRIKGSNIKMIWLKKWTRDSLNEEICES